MDTRKATIITLLCVIGYGELPGQDCKTTLPGLEYSGSVSITASGISCQRWDSLTPHSQPHINNFTGHSNYCRNPDREPDGPWCYTMDPNIRWQYCDIPFCDESPPFTSTSAKTAATTIGTTSISDMCPCQCQRNYTSDELKHMIEELRNTLSIDKKSTSSSIRRRICAEDDRQSSKNIGTIGIMFLCLPFVLFLFHDIVGLFVKT